MVVLLEGSPISTEELWGSVKETIRFLVTSLTKALLTPIPLFARAASSRKSLGGSKLRPFKNDGGHCSWGSSMLQIYIYWYPSLDLWLDTILSRSSTDNSFDLMAWFLLCHSLSTLYRQVCAFPNNVQSTEFTPSGLQSSCRNISRMINGNRTHLSKGSEYLCKLGISVLIFRHLQKCLQTCLHFVMMGYCIVCIF